MERATSGEDGRRESESLDRHSRRSNSRRGSSSSSREHKVSKRSRRQRDSDERQDRHRSSSKSDHDDDRRHHHTKRRHKKRRRSRDRSRSPSSDSYHDQDSHSSNSDSNDGPSSVENSSHERRRRRQRKKMKKKKSKHKSDKLKKSKKDRKRKHKDNDNKRDRKKKKSREEEEHVTAADAAELTDKARNYELAEALYALLVEHPTADMSINTLPLVLIKLAGGTSLDLRQMPNRSAALALNGVLETMQTFGLNQSEHQVWKWEVPGGTRPGAPPPRDERILLRIVRTLLNDIGLTMEAIEKDNDLVSNSRTSSTNGSKTVPDPVAATATETNAAPDNNAAETVLTAIENKTFKMLHSFQSKAPGQGGEEKKPFTLPAELGGLCNMILEGETIALDGLPDQKLRQSLEELFETCGLELCEMDEEEDDESSNDEEGRTKGEMRDAGGGGDENVKSMGYGLPEQSARLELARAKLASVMGACEQAVSDPTKLESAVTQKRPLKGPMRMPANYQAPEESSDEEGPAPVGEMAKRKESTLSKEMIKQQAEMRARQLKGAVTGVEELMSSDPNQREEWMLVPGKFDFLSSIKAGNGIKSRNFQAASKAGCEGAFKR